MRVCIVEVGREEQTSKLYTIWTEFTVKDQDGPQSRGKHLKSILLQKVSKTLN